MMDDVDVIYLRFLRVFLFDFFGFLVLRFPPALYPDVAINLPIFKAFRPVFLTVLKVSDAKSDTPSRAREKPSLTFFNIVCFGSFDSSFPVVK